MGIKNLNKFLTEKCSNQSIQKKHLHIFQGKTIVIDTSIYLYKFLEENERGFGESDAFAGRNQSEIDHEIKLIENMYLMISILLHYQMIPIFVFDGKPPKEKNELLKKRKLEKQEAESKYNHLKDQILDTTLSQETKQELQIEMSKLKKQFIRIKSKYVDSVKKMMDLYHVKYLDADGEADKLCAKMVIQKTAWACMSDDMDMFVYGCTRIMRHMSLSSHSVIFYNLNNILRELQLPLNEFREIMILSGTDYNLHQKVSLYKAIKLHQEYKQYTAECSPSTSSEIPMPPTMDFYKWLSEKHIPNPQQLYDIYHMFEIAEETGSNGLEETINSKDNPRKNAICIRNTKSKNEHKLLQEFLETYGFVFIL